MDEQEEKSRVFEEKTRIPTIMGLGGRLKQEYGEKRGIDTEQGGYYAAKEKKIAAEALAKELADRQAAAAARTAADAAALEARQSAQREALKRKGRRASILTSPQGITDPLGLPG